MHCVRTRDSSSKLILWIQKQKDLWCPPTSDQALAGKHYIVFSGMTRLTRLDVMQLQLKWFE
jgi:hypothetical protein